MTRAFPPYLRSIAVLGVLIVGLAQACCFNPFSPRIAPVLGASKPAPLPSTPSGVLRLFEWCYNEKAIAEYREIFTDDYEFFFSPTDSAGSAWRGEHYRREDELISATNLFVGGTASEPAARTISLQLDRNFLVTPDPDYVRFPPPNESMYRDRFGRWHKSIRTTVTLRIETDDSNQLEITGHARFYLVRGDSALIPQEMLDKGFRPDSTRWYIRRWDDETAQEGGVAYASARPSGTGEVSCASVPTTIVLVVFAVRSPTLLRSLQAWRQQFNVPILKLSTLDTVKQLALDPSQLGTVAAAKAVVTTADSLQSGVRQRLERLALQQRRGRPQRLGVVVVPCGGCPHHPADRGVVGVLAERQLRHRPPARLHL